MKACWMNGNLIDPLEAKVSVYDHGLLYGDGIFEGLRFYNGVAFRLKEHLDRLEDSAKALMLPIPYDQKSLSDAIINTIKASGQKNGYIRLVVTRGEGDLGLNPKNCGTGNVFILVDKLAIVSEEANNEGARVIIASVRRLGPDGIDPRIKSLNYLNNILARLEANQANADEAILLNQAGFIAEGSADNIFIVKNGILITPPVTDGALEGITRQAVIDAAQRGNIPFQEKSMTPFDLYNADEMFLTGSGAELIPVKEVAGRILNHPERSVFQKMRQLFSDLVFEETNLES